MFGGHPPCTLHVGMLCNTKHSNFDSILVLVENGTRINPCHQRMAPTIHELGVTGMGTQQRRLQEHSGQEHYNDHLMNPNGQKHTIVYIQYACDPHPGR